MTIIFLYLRFLKCWKLLGCFFLDFFWIFMTFFFNIYFLFLKSLLNFKKIFCNVFILGFSFVDFFVVASLEFLRFLLNVTEVTTEHQKCLKISTQKNSRKSPD